MGNSGLLILRWHISPFHPQAQPATVSQGTQAKRFAGPRIVHTGWLMLSKPAAAKKWWQMWLVNMHNLGFKENQNNGWPFLAVFCPKVNKVVPATTNQTMVVIYIYTNIYLFVYIYIRSGYRWTKSLSSPVSTEKDVQGLSMGISPSKCDLVYKYLVWFTHFKCMNGPCFCLPYSLRGSQLTVLQSKYWFQRGIRGQDPHSALCILLGSKDKYHCVLMDFEMFPAES